MRFLLLMWREGIDPFHLDNLNSNDRRFSREEADDWAEYFRKKGFGVALEAEQQEPRQIESNPIGDEDPNNCPYCHSPWCEYMVAGSDCPTALKLWDKYEKEQTK